MNHIQFLRQQAAKGGKAGIGESKVRGDSEYYSNLAKKSRKRRGDDRAGNSGNRRVSKRKRR